MTEAEAPPPEGRRPPSVLVTRLLGAAAAVVAAVLAVVGSFLPLVSGQLKQGNSVRFTISVSGWTLSGTAPSGTPLTTFGGAAQNGIPLTIAAAFLVVVALLILVAAPRLAPPVLRSAAVAGGAVALAFFTGILITVGVQAANFVNTIRPVGAAAGTAGYSASAGLGTGFWLELVAGVLAIAAVVLAALPAGRAPRHAQAPQWAAPPPAGDSPEG